MTIQEALEDVEVGFRQLEFAIKMLSFCELGKIDPPEFDTDHLVMLEGERLFFPSRHFSDPDALIKAAAIAVLLAFSATVLVLDKAFEVKGINSDPEATDDVHKLRTLIYMIRCAQAHGIADPCWVVRGKYLCKTTVNIDRSAISLDLRALNGRPFNVDQIGGYATWYRIRDVAVRMLLDG